MRAFAATTKNLVESARVHHNTSPVATAALGRTLTAGAIMGSMMKNDTDMLTLQIRGDGPIEGITVTADSHANVKGYVGNPDVMLPPKNGKLDVGGAVGIGLLQVIKDMGLKEPYVGQTILVSSEIAEDLTYYFATSEQVPSSVGLGVLMNKDNTVHCAGGFIVQVMPFISDEVLDKLEENKLLMKYKTAENDCATYQYVEPHGNCHEHLHMQCRKCGKIMHLECGLMQEIYEHLLTHHGFRLECPGSVLVGVCGDCEKE